MPTYPLVITYFTTLISLYYAINIIYKYLKLLVEPLHSSMRLLTLGRNSCISERYSIATVDNGTNVAAYNCTVRSYHSYHSYHSWILH